MSVDTVPAWIPQTLFVGLLAITGYFINGTLNRIKQELQISKIERAQLRNDLSTLEVGHRGNRFTMSNWNEERQRLEDELDIIRERLAKLENGSGE